ncbi:ABC transporter ATP-binding protein [Rothia sp. AR01]|uniref:ABC transporter ATP-binding protein n=1 Tax=Rothia santali TaxID=2949643 RepID=A0A9X2HB83_9MICC|nr:ABC transporter ATP-binding protein [Rothia santali]MCP3425025.1 ABC transporter ATP-binding protein [Rothia santali]
MTAVATERPLLQIRDLHIAFTSGKKDVPAVRGVDLTVYPGQTVAIVGESGSGKSTTAHAIIDLLPGTGHITGGSIEFDGVDLTSLSARKKRAYRGDRIGLVPQDPMSNLNPLYRVGTQIKEVLEVNDVARGKAADRRVVELLEEAGLGDAESRARQYPHEYSGGMRQRALIAAGLAARPQLLIADEPTSALDVTVQKQILDHLDGLTDELGVAVLLITHDLGLAAERADHLVVMYKGQVVESGPALQILQDPQHPYSQRLINSAPSLRSRRLMARERAEVRAEAAETALEHAEEVIGHGEGPESAGSPSSADAASADEFGGQVSAPVIRTTDLTKVFKLPGKGLAKRDFTAVDAVSFELARGTTTAIVGESGSGKSTVARMVLGLLEPTSGTVEFDGVDITTIRSRAQQLAFRRRVQPVFQNPYASLDPMYSIYRSIEEPLRLHGVGTGKERERKIRDLLDKVSLPAAVMSRYPNELSGGQRQRVAIARALALDPEVVVLDEAVSALDVLVQAQILKLLNDLQAELGLSYLFITHDLAVVRQIADQVLVMQQGRVVEQAGSLEVFDSPREEYTKRLLAAIPGRSVELAS